MHVHVFSHFIILIGDTQIYYIVVSGPVSFTGRGTAGGM